MTRVVDPELLAELEAMPSGALVDDPALLRELEGLAPASPADIVPNVGARATPRIAGTGSTFERARRVKDTGIAAAVDAFGADELGMDGSTGLTKIVTAAGDAVVRGINAAIHGGAAAVGQTAEEMGASQGDANRLRRDLIGMVESSAASPVARGAAAPKAVRGAPGAAPAPQATSAALEAADRIGVSVPRGAVGRVAQSVAGPIADAPIVGEPLRKAALKSVSQLEAKSTSIADELGGATIQGAGDTVKDSLIHWVKVASKDEAEKLFAPIDAIVKADTKSPPKGPLSRTGVAIQSLVRQAAESGLPPPTIIGKLSGALNKQGGLTYRGMQRLRTEIGDMMSGDITPEPGMSQRSLKAIYSALTDDIEFLVKREGGDAGVAAWKEANDRFKTEIIARREAIAKLTGSTGDAAAETVAQRMVTMASAKKGADLERLSEARKALNDDQWNELAGAAIGEMGKTKDGFSIAKWRTDYDRLSDAGKDLFFAPEHRAALDDINLVGKEFEALNRLGNPSGTARMAGLASIPALALTRPDVLLASVLGGAGMARMLAKPTSTKAAATWGRSLLNASKDFTADSYTTLKRAGLDMRSALDRDGITVGVIRPAIISNATDQQEQTP